MRNDDVPKFELPIPRDESIDALHADIYKDVLESFEQYSLPMPLNVLSQRFAKRIKRFGYESTLAAVNADPRLKAYTTETRARVVLPIREFVREFPDIQERMNFCRGHKIIFV